MFMQILHRFIDKTCNKVIESEIKMNIEYVFNNVFAFFFCNKNAINACILNLNQNNNITT